MTEEEHMGEVELLERAESTIWAAIRARQSEGITVRAGAVDEDGQSDGGLYHGECRCVVGALDAHACYPRIAPDVLGCEYSHVESLEAGFENWAEFGHHVEWYRLGRRISETLQQEEAACVAR